MITKQQIANHYRSSIANRPSPNGNRARRGGAGVEDPVNQWDALWESEYVNHVNDLALAR